MKESKSLVEFQRQEKFVDGKKTDDYMLVRYYPDKNNKWSSTSFSLSTEELEDFATAILSEVSKLKEKETQYVSTPILKPLHPASHIKTLE